MKYLLSVLTVLALVGCESDPYPQGKILAKAVGCFEGSVVVKLSNGTYASFMYKLDSAGKTVPCPK